MTPDKREISTIFNDPRFCGLWSYRPYGGRRRYCATITVDGLPTETELCDNWQDAVAAAGVILAETS